MVDQTILVIEDETAIRDMLSFTLSVAGYQVVEADNAETGLKLLLADTPDCVIVDWMLPGMSGVEFAKKVRLTDAVSSIPILMLTAKGEEADQVVGFESGADDYVVKPFSPRALVARCQALLRRSSPADVASDEIKVGDLLLDLTSYRFSVKDIELKLGPTEFKLMQFFMANPNRVYSRMQILDGVWGTNVIVEERTVDVHIRRLRQLLKQENVENTIQTVRGVGYRFSAD
ncbi:MAG TPA: phosphate regulon transcriptional regulatory protein PhoB [Thiomicrospira sp.]|jgi:two-component system phosphate regulon response regulator PhoB|nr:phosphate regulon transcriptional regulatory protein PhoB [Thiomicrospira sp.]